MTRIAEIKTAIRHMLAGTAKVLGATAVVLLLVLAPGCKKEVTGPVPAVFGGPADVTLILNNSSDRNSANPIKEPATKAVTIDEINTVHTLKIYAFKHDPNGTQNDELVGYGSYEGITGAGPHYIRMELSASGEIDFYVIANDIYAATATVLDEESTRFEIENVRFTGLASPGTDAAVAVPMSNIPDGTATDRNNFTYTVKDNTVIPIEVSRAMARLSFSFAKSAKDDRIYINRITIQNEPESAGYFTSDGAPAGLNLQVENIVSSPTEITALNTTGSVEGNMQELADEDYLLPNNVGVSNSAGEFEDNADRAYLVTVDYSVNGVGKTKEIYLPPVRPNDWVQIKAIFKEDIDNCEFHIIAVPWEQKVMDDIIFD